MAEKYIRAAECEKYFYDHLDDYNIISAMNAIEEMPTADVVEVVRCKDCKYYRKMYKLCSCRSDKFNVYLNDNDFCSYGERMTDNGLKVNYKRSDRRYGSKSIIPV